ncbi:MAG: hypothetical protein ACON3Z_06925 [Bradymonadia bacterium]
MQFINQKFFTAVALISVVSSAGCGVDLEHDHVASNYVGEAQIENVEFSAVVRAEETIEPFTESPQLADTLIERIDEVHTEDVDLSEYGGFEPAQEATIDLEHALEGGATPSLPTGKPGFGDGYAGRGEWKLATGELCRRFGGELEDIVLGEEVAGYGHQRATFVCQYDDAKPTKQHALILGGHGACKPESEFQTLADEVCDQGEGLLYERGIQVCDASSQEKSYSAFLVVCK